MAKTRAEGQRSQFFEDCLQECGASEVKGWKVGDDQKEFFRFTQWVRRVLEECTWWELNGGGKNVNRHLQLRLQAVYQDLFNNRSDLFYYETYASKMRLVAHEGVEPAQPTWEDWYRKRATEAEKWYKHWCSHIGGIPGATLGNRPNRRLMRFRDVYQLLCKSKKSPYKH